jgi:hypothetical protein
VAGAMLPSVLPHMCVGVCDTCLCAAACSHLQVLQLHHLERLRLREEQLHRKQRAACLNNSNATSSSTPPNSSSSSSCPPAEGLASLAEPPDPDSPAFMAQLSLVGEGLESLPNNCRPLCAVRGRQEERAAELALHRALPLLPLELRASRRIRCVYVLVQVCCLVCVGSCCCWCCDCHKRKEKGADRQ